MTHAPLPVSYQALLLTAAQARLEAANAVIAAGDAIDTHREVCDTCSQRDNDNLYWDNGNCKKWTKLLDQESEARSKWHALSATAAPKASA